MICFQISIFAKGNTAKVVYNIDELKLWFAFKLVSLQKEIQLIKIRTDAAVVVICFQISIFAKGNTANAYENKTKRPLWFAFKLVSLQKEIQQLCTKFIFIICCDLLSN